MSNRAPIGLIAGNSVFPLLVLRAARRLGHDVTVIALHGETEAAIDALAKELGGTSVTWIQLGELGRCLATFAAAGVTQAVMAGQVKHVKLFGGVAPDPALAAALAKLGSQNTDALIAAVAGVLESKGITLLDSTALLAICWRSPRPHAANRPTRCGRILRLATWPTPSPASPGQTIIVADRAVGAVEAMEGTDAAIARAGLASGRAS
jgi:DUF1009 family protein